MGNFVKENREIILPAMKWYFSKANRAIDKIIDMKIPADNDDLRFYYGVYVESIFSALDLFRENGYITHKGIQEILEDNAYVYLRELRNSIVHRGYDLATAGTVINERVFLRMPSDIFDKKGGLIQEPTEEFLLHFLLNIDTKIRDLIFDQTVGLIPDVLTQEEQVKYFEDFKMNVSNNPHIPDDIKEMFALNFEKIKVELKNSVESRSKKISDYESVIKHKGFF
jgi:hypothetical protein